MKEDILQDDWALKIKKNLFYKYGFGVSNVRLTCIIYIFPKYCIVYGINEIKSKRKPSISITSSNGTISTLNRKTNNLAISFIPVM